MDSETPDSSATRHGVARRVAIAGVLLLVLVSAAGYAAYRTTTQEPNGSWPLDRAWLREHPPVATPKVVDDRHPEWKTHVWVSTDEHVCIAMTGPAVGTNKSLSCYPAPAPRRMDAAPSLTSKPLLQVAPYIEGEALVVGTVSGSAATVDVTLFGITTTGTVVVVADTDEGVVGAYAVWLPVEDHGGYGWRDITEVVARDDNGRALDRIT